MSITSKDMMMHKCSSCKKRYPECGAAPTFASDIYERIPLVFCDLIVKCNEHETAYPLTTGANK